MSASPRSKDKEESAPVEDSQAISSSSASARTDLVSARVRMSSSRFHSASRAARKARGLASSVTTGSAA